MILDGNALEVSSFNLQKTVLRGILFVKEMKWHQNPQVELEVIRSPQLLILDSEGYLHNFQTQYSEGKMSKFGHMLSMDKFLKRYNLLEQRFNKKEKPRGKSQSRKVVILQEKKRAKSQARIDLPPSETKIS